MSDLRFSAQVQFLNLLRNEYMILACESQKTQEKIFSVTEHCSFQMLLSSISCLKPVSMKMSEALTGRYVHPADITIFDWLVHPSPLWAVKKGCNLQQPLVGEASSVLAVYILRLLPVIISDICRQQGEPK